MEFWVRGLREIFLAKCQDNQKTFQQNAIGPWPEVKALPLTLGNPELDFQGLIRPSFEVVSVCVLVANKPVLLLHVPGTAGSKQNPCGREFCRTAFCRTYRLGW